MSKFLNKLKNLIPSKRKLIQLYSALLFNANIKGFFNGQIYKGQVKNICTPGINCYSCPGASGACPLGSLQNALNTTEKSAIYYVVGIIMLYGILFGRFICGFLCPFGLIQELLYKIKTPKLKKNRFTKILSYFKYVLLVFLVFIVPILYGLRDVTLPGFCKYICPAGTIEGAFGLLSNKINESQLASLGPIFTWKFILTVSIIVGCVFIFRLFCRFLCPLGALYGLFNKFSVLGIKLEKPKCIDCGLCISHCKMDISHVGDHECISCGECVSVCPTKAISWKGGKIVLPPDEIAPVTPEMSEEECLECISETENKNKKLRKRRLITRITAAVLMVSLLVSALVYYNFIDKPIETELYAEGDRLEDVYISTYNGLDGYDAEPFNPAANSGKVTVINFWHADCGGCKEEIKHVFSEISEELKDKATFLVITCPGSFVERSYPLINGWKTEYPGTENIVWGVDEQFDPEMDPTIGSLYTKMGGTGAFPLTVIIDTNGNVSQFVTSGFRTETESDILLSKNMLRVYIYGALK